MQPLLELQTRPRVCPVSQSLSMVLNYDKIGLSRDKPCSFHFSGVSEERESFITSTPGDHPQALYPEGRPGGECKPTFRLIS